MQRFVLGFLLNFNEIIFMQTLVDIQLHNRKLFHRFLSQFTLEQLNTIPEGFNNNIVWNIAHSLVTQQLLMYKLSGLSLHIPQEWVGMFAKGTKPERDLTADEVSAIDAALFSTHEEMIEDLKQGVFSGFKPYTTSTKMELNDIAAAQTFVLFHDGLHIGSVLALAKLV